MIPCLASTSIPDTQYIDRIDHLVHHYLFELFLILATSRRVEAVVAISSHAITVVTTKFFQNRRFTCSV
ncbi:MAG: hypothetical protein GC152_02580 [Alphaproteobacteria bacterium]|nr:hypothetical protein [Alphaproteobacteria bacterium]